MKCYNRRTNKGGHTNKYRPVLFLPVIFIGHSISPPTRLFIIIGWLTISPFFADTVKLCPKTDREKDNVHNVFSKLIA